MQSHSILKSSAWKHGSGALLFGACLLGGSQVEARACPYRPSSHLNFADTDPTPARCAGVTDSNPDWRTFQGNWDNKADVFFNDFTSSQNACIYDGYRYTGAKRTVTRGQAVVWSNKVSSNRNLSPVTPC